MFQYEDNKQKVGAYLQKLIEQKYPSHRQFCKAYLITIGLDANDEELRKLSNRLSQILKGKKAIQTYDLPIITDLLKVSCEEILSCGKSFVPISGHITNYEVAFSDDPKVWAAYLERPDKLVLNPDEYNKTVIDYAIEFKNYAFIKYLMDHGDIWFVDDSKYDCSNRAFGFAAGTNIKRREIGYIDTYLDNDLRYHCEERGLRQSVIALAMENKDFDVLDSLRAREVPALYQLCLYAGNAQIKCHDYYNDDVTEAIALSNDKVLRYFCEEFQIQDQQGRSHSFIYPFLNEVITKLVIHKSKYAKPVIRAAIEHNKKVHHRLTALLNDSASRIQNEAPDWMEITPETIKKEAMQYFSFFCEDGFISYLFPKGRHDYVTMCTNVVRTDAVSNDFLLDSLIKELNKTFDDMQNIEPVISENIGGADHRHFV